MWEMAWQELHANICFVSEALITPCVLECGGVGLIAAEAYIYTTIYLYVYLTRAGPGRLNI